MCAFFFGLVEDGGMKKVLEPGEAPTAVVRRGIPKNLSLDHDAVLILKELSPSTKGYGRLVSELLRREDERRRERQRLREVVLAALQEPACL
jgi:hypothetical protein